MSKTMIRLRQHSTVLELTLNELWNDVPSHYSGTWVMRAPDRGKDVYFGAPGPDEDPTKWLYWSFIGNVLAVGERFPAKGGHSDKQEEMIVKSHLFLHEAQRLEKGKYSAAKRVGSGRCLGPGKSGLDSKQTLAWQALPIPNGTNAPSGHWDI